jgi:hypothetical protein
MRGYMAMNNYFTNTTRAEMEAERNAILNTTAEDIRGFAKMISDVMAQNIICVYGNDQKIKENDDLFKEIRAVIN